MEHARPLLLRLEAARADIARLHATRSVQLTVAASPLALSASLAQPLAHIRRSAPGLAVSLHVLGREAVVAAVMPGTPTSLWWTGRRRPPIRCRCPTPAL
ncbi:hypothetical protein ACFQ0X_02430 [Streptomyces rectiviolaceus]